MIMKRALGRGRERGAACGWWPAGGLSGLALAQGLLKDGPHLRGCSSGTPTTPRQDRLLPLHMNADGGEALAALACRPTCSSCTRRTSRRTYDRRESVGARRPASRAELAAPPGARPTRGERPHTGVHRRTLRAILRARLGESFHPGRAVTGYQESPDKVTVTLADGTTAEGDVPWSGADGIRSAVRRQEAPRHPRSSTPGRPRPSASSAETPLTTPRLAAQLPPAPVRGRAHRGRPNRLAAAHRGPTGRARPAPEAAQERSRPDVTLEAGRRTTSMISCSVFRRAREIPPRPAPVGPRTRPPCSATAMLAAIEGWHPAARGPWWRTSTWTRSS